MSRHWRCKNGDQFRLWSDEAMSDYSKTNGMWEPVEVWPEGTVARLREAVASLADSLQRWLDQDECDCGPEGHICGRPTLLADIETARAALAETEASL